MKKQIVLALVLLIGSTLASYATVKIKVKIENVAFVGMAVPPCNNPQGPCTMEFEIDALVNPGGGGPHPNGPTLDLVSGRHYFEASLNKLESDYQTDGIIDQTDNISTWTSSTITLGTFLVDGSSIGWTPGPVSVTVVNTAINQSTGIFRIYVN